MSNLINKDKFIKAMEELNRISFYEANEHSKETYYELKKMAEQFPPERTVKKDDLIFALKDYFADDDGIIVDEYWKHEDVIGVIAEVFGPQPEDKFVSEYVIPLDYKGSHVSISDTKENCLMLSLKYIQKNGYMIYGLKRTACGNSHDENWQSEYTMIDNGGPFADNFADLSKLKRDLYRDAPIIKKINALTDEYINDWIKPFQYCSGEEKCRYIFAARDEKIYVFSASITYVEETQSTHEKICALKVIGTS